jgi:hypothetical protein
MRDEESVHEGSSGLVFGARVSKCHLVRGPVSPFVLNI